MVSDGGQWLVVVDPSYGKVQCRQFLGKRSMMSGFRSTMNLRKVGKRDRIFCSLSTPLPADLPLGLFHLPSLVLSSTKNGAFGCSLIPIHVCWPWGLSLPRSVGCVPVLVAPEVCQQ